MLCVGYLGEMIESEFGDGSAFGVELRYSFDGPKLLGTGGALRRALPLLGDTFFVLYGDLRICQSISARWPAAFQRSGQPALDDRVSATRARGIRATSGA